MKTITKRKLGSQFGAHAVSILDGRLKPLPRKKGKMQEYQILKPLPTPEEFAALRNEKFKTTVSGLVSDAFSEFSTLADELGSWYDNLPESFQQGDKGSQLEDAKSTLEGLSEPDVPAAVVELATVFIPSEECGSRSARCSEAASMLREAVEVIQGHINDCQSAAESDGGNFDASELESLMQECENAADEAEGVDFPGMY